MTSEPIEAKRTRTMDRLRAIHDKDERLRYIIAAGKELPAIPDALRHDSFLVKGCISRAWLVPQKRDDRLHFMADSEAAIVKGIIAILLSVYNDATPAEILATDAGFLSEVGVTEHLSMNRRNGLSNMIKLIQHYATVFQDS